MHGRKQDIYDACLLLWKERRKKSAEFDHVMPAVLTYMTGQTQGNDYDEWIAERLEQEDLPDESTWLKHVMQSDNPRVAKAAMEQGKEILDGQWQPVVQAVLVDADTPIEIKWDAMALLDKKCTQATLVVLADLLDNDQAQVRIRHTLRFKDAHHPIVELIRCSREYAELRPKPKSKPKPKKTRAKAKPEPKTLGDLALKKLKGITRKDFGKDTEAWQDWIDTHWQAK